MNETNTQHHTDTVKQSSLKESVLTRIDRDNVSPKSKFWCACSDHGVWLFWALTVIVGALAFAESLYIGMHSGIEFYELTHDSLFQFLVVSLPYIWVLAFLAMVILAYFNMRRTKYGYKYPLWQIIISSIFFTFVAGLLLSIFGVGKYIDRMMNSMPMPYESVEERLSYLWTHPEAGRITGMYVRSLENGVVLFRDVAEHEWHINAVELTHEDAELLLSGEKVRIVGEADMKSPRFQFYGCAVRPLMYEGDMPVKSIRDGRIALISAMKRFEDTNTSAEPPMRCMEIMKKLMPH